MLTLEQIEKMRKLSNIQTNLDLPCKVYNACDYRDLLDMAEQLINYKGKIFDSWGAPIDIDKNKIPESCNIDLTGRPMFEDGCISSIYEKPKQWMTGLGDDDDD